MVGKLFYELFKSEVEKFLAGNGKKLNEGEGDSWNYLKTIFSNSSNYKIINSINGTLDEKK